jgi:hypothetical protein
MVALVYCCISLAEPHLRAQISKSPAAKSEVDDFNAVLARLRATIGSVLSKPQPPLFERHLRSVLAICEIGALQVRFGGSGEPQMRADLLGYLRTVEEGLNQDGYRPETYLSDGLRPLILARLSKTDGSLQFYLLNLPAHWDPNRAYPLFVQLHGFGPSSLRHT